MKNIFKIIGINLCVLFGLCIVIEIVLRVAKIGYGSAPLENSPVFHHVHPKNYTYLSYSAQGEFSIPAYFDNQSFAANPTKVLDDSLAARLRIAFFGDSFTESTCIAYDSSFVGITANKTDYFAINYGVSSYSSQLSYLQWKYHAKPVFNPDIVFLLLYSNDIRDDLGYQKTARYDAQNELIAIDGGYTPDYIKLLRKIYLIRLIRKTYNVWKAKQEWEAQQMANYSTPQKMIGDMVEENPTLDSTITASYILKLQQETKAMNKTFVLMAVPSKHNNLKRIFNDSTEFSRKCEKWAKKNEITYLDLVTPFENYTKATNKNLFFNADIHCNGMGQYLIGQEILKFLAQQPDAPRLKQ